MEDEKSPLAIEKYLRDVKALFTWKKSEEVTRRDAVLYKKQLEEMYAPTSVNSMLAGLNGFFEFLRYATDLVVAAAILPKQTNSKRRYLCPLSLASCNCTHITIQ